MMLLGSPNNFSNNFLIFIKAQQPYYIFYTIHTQKKHFEYPLFFLVKKVYIHPQNTLCLTHYTVIIFSWMKMPGLVPLKLWLKKIYGS